MVEYEPNDDFTSLVEYQNKKMNPLMEFGPGISQFFKSIESLVKIFFFLTLLALLQMFVLHRINPSFIQESEASFGRLMASFSLGSLSEIAPVCWKLPYKAHDFHLICNGGRTIQHVYELGVQDEEDKRCSFDNVETFYR